MGGAGDISDLQKEKKNDLGVEVRVFVGTAPQLTKEQAVVVLDRVDQRVREWPRCNLGDQTWGDAGSTHLLFTPAGPILIFNLYLIFVHPLFNFFFCLFNLIFVHPFFRPPGSSS